MQTPQIKICSPPGALLGESPLWVAAQNTVYWVDILGYKIHQYCLTEQSNHVTELDEAIYWLQLADKSCFIAALKSGIWLLDQTFNKIKQLHPQLEKNNMRFNDAKVDSDGKLWFGTMDNNEQAASGQLFCLNKGKLTLEDDGYLVTNGPAFSNQKNWLYHNDTANKKVYRFKLNANSQLTDKSVFIDFEQYSGFPDGLTVDQNDEIWIAHWQGQGVSRFSKSGKQRQFIKLPAMCITSLTFAGANLDRLFATSAAIKDDSKFAGCLFEILINPSEQKEAPKQCQQIKGNSPNIYISD
ncbi:SMP-30/gluconolactonase/LRE family protein [Catenovulum sp. 2E275]|uniref:SMP-30/gluconolactonase/LRE family protein n=1 Tax=Catenovulum sp. 2E275 TaxID=2980497 RepID=UPI0021D21805|nr:SMP-30/gluconolactonase/LRE family protein [Catenovulum sp. 2E275]MCU4676107.1 SMP-30/gluconolactonase/LRE family protein [Catenovulum sp. 2E275]